MNDSFSLLAFETTSWSATASASTIAASNATVSINNCWSLFSSSSFESSVEIIDDSLSFLIVCASIVFFVFNTHNDWPSRIGSPDLKLNSRLSGASKTRTIVEPKLKSPKLSPRLSNIPFVLRVVWNVFSNLGRRRLLVLSSYSLE